MTDAFSLSSSLPHGAAYLERFGRYGPGSGEDAIQCHRLRRVEYTRRRLFYSWDVPNHRGIGEDRCHIGLVQLSRLLRSKLPQAAHGRVRGRGPADRFLYVFFPLQFAVKHQSQKLRRGGRPNVGAFDGHTTRAVLAFAPGEVNQLSFLLRETPARPTGPFLCHWNVIIFNLA